MKVKFKKNIKKRIVQRTEFEVQDRVKHRFEDESVFLNFYIDNVNPILIGEISDTLYEGICQGSTDKLKKKLDKRHERLPDDLDLHPGDTVYIIAPDGTVEMKVVDNKRQ